MYILKLLLFSLLSFITSLPNTILIPKNNNTNNNQKKIILHPKQRSISLPIHHHDKDKNTDTHHGKKRIHLPDRIMENFPKQSQEHYQENKEQEELQQRVNEGKDQSIDISSPNTPQLISIPIQQKKVSNNNLQVLFYDPSTLSNNIPQQIFDEDGNDVDLSGQQVLLLPPDKRSDADSNNGTINNTGSNNTQPISTLKIVQGEDLDRIHNLESTKRQSIQSSLSELKKNHPKDNMILFGTILTMSLFVGALTGKRIRKSCNFLAYFIESEDLEEEDKDTGSHVGSLNVMGSNYDTFGKYGGEMRWRGDLEKFDV